MNGYGLKPLLKARTLTTMSLVGIEAVTIITVLANFYAQTAAGGGLFEFFSLGD